MICIDKFKKCKIVLSWYNNILLPVNEYIVKYLLVWFIAFGWKCLCRVYAVIFLNQQKIIQLIRIKYVLTSDSFYDKRNDKKNRVYDNFQRSYFSISLSIIIIGY